MTLQDAKRITRDLGFSLTRRDGEYHLAPYAGTPDQQEAQAYYTPDIDDALSTAWAMFKYRIGAKC